MALDDRTQTGIIPASGNLTLDFTPDHRQNWRVDSASMNGPDVGASAVGSIFRDTQFVTFFIATADTCEGNPVPLGNGRHFKVKWTGATPGATVQATIWFDDGQG